MKNVLLIAFYFPPRNHVAAVRAGCFAMYLPEFDWRPTVICADLPMNSAADPGLIGELPPETEVHYVPNRRPAGAFEKVLVHKLTTYLRPGLAPVFWRRAALAKARELFQRRHFDAIWATADPLVTLGLADQLATENRTPWVADLRDPVNVIPFGKWYRRPQARHFERLICRRADRVVTVMEGFARGLRQPLNRRVTVIPNGYDPPRLPESSEAAGDRFVILHGGNVEYPRQRPDLLMRALEECLRRGTISRERVCLQFIGTKMATLRRACGDVAERLPLETRARIPRYELLNLQRMAAVLAVFPVPREQGVLPAKLFELLAARRPILAVPDDQGEVSGLLERTGAGISLSKVPDIADQLGLWYREWDELRLHPREWNRDEISKYSRYSQAGRLSQLLDEMTGEVRFPRGTALKSVPLEKDLVAGR